MKTKITTTKNTKTRNVRVDPVYHYGHKDVMWGAFRYTLGRKTGIVTPVVDYLIHHKDRFGTDKNLVIKEIDEAIEKGHAGTDCDVEDWKRLKKELENVQKS